MDEPAAAPAVEQTRHVLDSVRRFRDQGVGVVFISHNMQPVLVARAALVVIEDESVGANRQGDCYAAALGNTKHTETDQSFVR